ncbi:MAG TPA: DUF4191 domain-containing protein [Candidatus Lumbricidophila sp.]|nr:DUF4191 domain-containing protein [Candidatus Lumbricidophila sp.]
MARTPKETKVKEPGRIKQMWQVFQMTRRVDSAAQWWIIAGFLLPVLVSVVVGLLIPGNVVTLILWIIVGVLGGLLVAMIILGRRAERAAYAQIEGQPGAVGAVLKSGLRGGWIGAEMPIQINGKTQDAVYRAIGRGGVVLVGEGPVARTQRMLEDEQRKVSKVIPNVAITLLQVGEGDGAVELHKLPTALRKLKKTLTKQEVLAVSNRLASLKTGLPVPKGIDPMKARAQRPRMR